ncbi:MAG: hypothetical protein JSW39_17945 [Desulfobacterales bacterium]|nr:MAG: hypothetical protein JSW39_17945 [Desulfobacterales bacterium]
MPLCMHAGRITRQRRGPPHNGQLAQTSSTSWSACFAVAASAEVQLQELAIIYRYRCLPDYFHEVPPRLFRIPPVAVLD